MDFSFESFLVALAVIVPGFLTTYLVNARTPAMGESVSTFWETLESLLRSLIIQILTLPIMGLILRFLVLTPTRLSRIAELGLNDFVLARPFLSLAVVLGWLVLALLIAFLFGAFWDPLKSLSDHLANTKGAASLDPWYRVYCDTMALRKRNPEAQLWILVRIKDGDVYTGEFDQITFRTKEKSRELLLRNVTHHQDYGKPTCKKIQLSYILVDVANCVCLEAILQDRLVNKIGNDHQKTKTLQEALDKSEVISEDIGNVSDAMIPNQLGKSDKLLFPKRTG